MTLADIADEVAFWAALGIGFVVWFGLLALSFVGCAVVSFR